MSEKTIRWFAIAMLGIMFALCVPTTKAETQKTERLTAPTYVRARSHNGKRLKLIWKTMSDADGYQIYQYNKKKRKYKRVAEVKSSATSWLSPKTKKLTKYKLRAYRYNESGEKQFGSFSYVVSAVAYNRKDKKVNAGTVSAPHKFYDNKLGLYETVQLQAEVKKSKYAKKNKKAKVVDNRLRWYTTDSSIATVDGNGLLKSMGKTGECYVYARAHNGNSTGYMKVSVSNYARPETFRNLEYVNEDMKRLLTTYEEDLKTVAEYFEIYNKTHTPQTGKFYLSEDRMNMIASSGMVSYEPVRENLWRLMDQHPGHIQIRIQKNSIQFDMSDGIWHNELIFAFIKPTYPVQESEYSFLVYDRWLYECYPYPG